jgi:predicted nucleic acid-binding protein
MSFYFLDTSALVKRYHLELGTEIVDALFAENSSTKMISDLGVIEFYSTFAKKVRTGELSDAAFHDAIRSLAHDVQDNVVEITSFTDADKRTAGMLIEKYGLSQNLRTLDALQLAVMTRLGPQTITRVLCADRAFIAIIEQEGFTVTNPVSSQ